MQQIEFFVALSLLLIIGVPMLFYFLERPIRKVWKKDLQRGNAMISLVEEKLSSDEYELFLFSFFDGFENALENSSEGKREYDVGKPILLQRQDTIGIRFQKTYQKWLLQNDRA